MDLLMAMAFVYSGEEEMHNVGRILLDYDITSIVVSATGWPACPQGCGGPASAAHATCPAPDMCSGIPCTSQPPTDAKLHISSAALALVALTTSACSYRRQHRYASMPTCPLRL